MKYPIVFVMMMVYLIVTVGTAVILSRRVRASDSFLVAARSLPWFLVMAVIVIALVVSAFTTRKAQIHEHFKISFGIK